MYGIITVKVMLIWDSLLCSNDGVHFETNVPSSNAACYVLQIVFASVDYLILTTNSITVKISTFVSGCYLYPGEWK